VVACKQAGPRCSITSEQSEPMEGAAPLLRVDVALSVQDEPQPSVAEEDAALAQRCLELVCGACGTESGWGWDRWMAHGIEWGYFWGVGGR
jgi:hypothetical protein